MINTEHLKYCHHVIGYLESSLILFFDCYKICKLLTNFERNYYMLINNFFLLLSDGSRI